MVSLWGSNKDGDENDAENGSTTPRNSEGGSRPPPSRREYERREADERTRLLPAQPRPPHSDGYLDPDDPAVSYLFATQPSRGMKTDKHNVGVSLQPLDRPIHPLPDNPLPGHHLLVVGAATCQHLCLPSWSSHAWLRLLRLLLHYPERRHASCCPPLLLGTLKSYAGFDGHHHCHSDGGHDHDPRNPQTEG